MILRTRRSPLVPTEVGSFKQRTRDRRPAVLEPVVGCRRWSSTSWSPRGSRTRATSSPGVTRLRSSIRSATSNGSSTPPLPGQPSATSSRPTSTTTTSRARWSSERRPVPRSGGRPRPDTRSGIDRWRTGPRSRSAMQPSSVWRHPAIPRASRLPPARRRATDGPCSRGERHRRRRRRTDLLGPERTDELTRLQFHSMRRLANLSDEVRVLPTHGAGSFCAVGSPGERRTSTIAEERRPTPRSRRRTRTPSCDDS